MIRSRDLSSLPLCLRGKNLTRRASLLRRVRIECSPHEFWPVVARPRSVSMSERNGNTSLRLKTGLAEMLKGGVIMDVTDAAQAEIAQKAGAVAVMALERVPAQIRAQGGVARMAAPKQIREIMETVSVPVMAKCRIGHFARAPVLQVLGVDYIDESEVLTPDDDAHHVDK